ncbi:MAG: hypothetical protein ONB06_11065, partial [candidate division KSB1 bacterium]|nr:hypothetical protein [candidate division KSB1 bacterium]
FVIMDIPDAPKSMVTLWLLLSLANVAFFVIFARVVAEISSVTRRIDRDMSTIMYSLRKAWPLPNYQGGCRPDTSL